MNEYRQGWATRAAEEPDDEIIKSGVNPDNIRLVMKRLFSSKLLFKEVESAPVCPGP